jgi:hypothetical protein
MERMIRTFLVPCVIILLAIPTLSHAGSATSSGDLNTGGTVQIPIIPEKAPGKLAALLALSGFTGQNNRFFLTSTHAITGAYGYNQNEPAASGNLLTANYTAPVPIGGWAGLSFYLADTVWANFYYGQVQTNPNQWRGEQQYGVNLIYNPNPAVRLGFEYAYYTTRSGRESNAVDLANPSSAAATGLQNKGTLTVISFAAQYLF